jgi:translation initiation factor IF-2
MTLEDFHARMLAGEKRELNIVVKADVNGSIEVLRASLAKVGNDEVHANVIHAGVGGINESDVLLASASDAVIIGFHVTASPKAQKLAEQEGVEIRSYRVIYELIDNVKAALEGMLSPDKKETITGHASVRAVFRSSQYGNIAGCYVTDGEILRGSPVRLLRDSVVVYEGKIGSIRRNKEDVRVVLTDFECGIKLDNFEDVKDGDIIEVYKIESVAKLLE